MAATSETRAWDAVVTSTLEAEMGEMADNIIKEVPVLNWFNQTGALLELDGGERIKADLLYGKNTTVQSQDQYDLLDTTPQDGITAAFFDWCEVTGTLVISRRERRKNSGKHKRFDLIQAKRKQLEMSFWEDTNTQIFSDGTGNGGKDIDGLQAAVPSTTTSGTYGGINRANEAWWRNQTSAAVGSFAANGLDTLRQLWRLTLRSWKSSPIDLLIFDGTEYDAFEKLHVLAIQFPVTGKVNKAQFDLGIPSFQYKNATVISDPALDDTNRGYGLNSKFIKFAVDKESRFQILPAVTPSDQLATVAPMVLMANIALNNARKHLVMAGMTA